MKILRKSLGILVSLMISGQCLAETELHLELNNQTNRTLCVQQIDGKDSIELTQVQVLGDFPSKIAPHSSKIMALKFDDGIMTNIAKDRAKVTYEIVCPNGAGTDTLTITARAYIIPNPRSISYGILVNKKLAGNHCTKLQDGDGEIEIVDGQASLTVIHS